MKKFLVFFAIFAALIFVASCGSGSEKKAGELGNECYGNGTCNEGLKCDTASNTCVEDQDETPEQTDDTTNTTPEQTDDSTDTTPEQTDDSTDTTSDDDNDSGDTDTGTDADTNADTADTVDDTDADTNADTADTVDDTDTTVTPCDPNPCNGIDNSNGVCTEEGETYSCGCEQKYFWNDGKCKRIPLAKICTGQNKCYDSKKEIECPASPNDNYYGQDAQHTSECIAKSFTGKKIESKNLIYDNNTGLMWQQTVMVGETYDWEGAKTFCSKEYAGFSDWRLPSPMEFRTISNIGRYAPAFIIDYFPNIPINSEDIYSTAFWTSQEDKSNSNKAFIIDTYTANTSSSELKTKPYHVLCVRGEKLLVASFETEEINGKVVVKDSTSGLMWQKIDENSDKYLWIDALKHCENSDYAGYTDWRLPNENELSSLLNYDKSEPPYSDYPDMPSASCWSSSGNVYEIFRGWSVSFKEGVANNVHYKSDMFHALCVR